MSHLATLIAIVLVAVPARGLPQGETDRAREDALRALKGGEARPLSQDLERSKQKWPEAEREIEAGILDQQKALDRGGRAAEDYKAILKNRAEMQETPVALYLYGRFLGLLDHVDDARSNFEQALRIDPYFPWAHHGLGTCFAMSHKTADAARAYERALELNPGFVRSMEPLAFCLLQQNRPDDAEKILRRLVELQRDDAAGWVALGKLQFQRTRFAEAVAAFRQALEKKPGSTETRRLLAHALDKADKPAEAQAVFQALLKDDPNDVLAMMGMGQTCFELGENHAAADWFQKVIDHWTPSAPPKPELLEQIERLRRLPAVEKRDPKQKSPQEWAQILLNSTEPERCREAIRVLSTYPDFDKDVYNAFLHAVKNKDTEVRVLALRELGSRWQGLLNELTPIFVLFLEDKDRLVRAMAARNLGMSEDPAAVPPLVKTVKQERDPYVFREVYGALWRLTTSEMPALFPKELDAAAMDSAAKGWEAWYAENRDRYKKYEPKPK